MPYTTSLLERDADDTNGQRFADSLAHHLTYWWSNGLEDFIVTPVVSDGQTIGVIVGAYGENPWVVGGFDVFKKITGFKTVEGVAEFMGVKAQDLQKSVSQQAEQRKEAEARSAEGASLTYSTQLIERDNDDTTGRELQRSVGMEMNYLSDNGFDGFLLVPIQNAGNTVSIIVAAKGSNPRSPKSAP